MQQTTFQRGAVVRGTRFGECQIQEFIGYDEKGREVYSVITAGMQEINGFVTNKFRAVVIPTLTITGVDL